VLENGDANVLDFLTM